MSRNGIWAIDNFHVWGIWLACMSLLGGKLLPPGNESIWSGKQLEGSHSKMEMENWKDDTTSWGGRFILDGRRQILTNRGLLRKNGSLPRRPEIEK